MLSDGSRAKIKYLSGMLSPQCKAKFTCSWKGLCARYIKNVNGFVGCVVFRGKYRQQKSTSVFKTFPNLSYAANQHLSMICLVGPDCFPLRNTVLKIAAPTDFTAIAMLYLTYKFGILPVLCFTHLLCQPVQGYIVQHKHLKIKNFSKNFIKNNFP